MRECVCVCVCSLSNLAQLVGGPTVVIKPMVKTNSNSPLLPGCVVSVIFRTKRCFSPDRDLQESVSSTKSAL